MLFDGILFDLDGTLWDSVPEITQSWTQVLTRCGAGRPLLTVEEMRSCMGLLAEDIAARVLPHLSGTRQAELMEACFAAENGYLETHGAAVYPGVKETLERLSGQCPLFVVSNCQVGYIPAFYRGTGLGKYFTDDECAGHTGLSKSGNIRLVVRRHNLKHPVYVGDTALDCTSARDAGIPFLHAAYGFGTVEGTPAIHSFSELPEALERLSREGKRVNRTKDQE